ncbi:dethiobiotin synthase [Singulisphaera acidiphila]|uniref:ATP-dependent dethiobiotin synthetase BioD n=1 Tax=Singulisphaera acidiphila (strain ATCC BAA-1392 / DSM 18658 / VKM B-2454 / MOB10) TaxID=886293 RepID=L0DMP4_SINAD|nr:dethiobiotin synthase [Singulisphaera acidiphila]AGA30654.1 dethiobiotin synthase [Singulisphaera acidiphila DSM 18658]
MTVHPGLFVVGTDTGVGKTRVAAAIARILTGQGRRVGVLKPVATGAIRRGESWECEDGEALIRAVGGSIPLERVVPLIYEEPLAPSVAARRLGTPLAPEQVVQGVRASLGWWSERADVMVVEGVGGLLAPLAERMTVVDLAEALDYPLLIVARRGLGTLNHTLMTVECAQRRGLRVAGIVLNSPEPGEPGVAELTNAEELARLVGPISILGEPPYQPDEESFAIALASMEWYDRFERPRQRALFADEVNPG